MFSVRVITESQDSNGNVNVVNVSEKGVFDSSVVAFDVAKNVSIEMDFGENLSWDKDPNKNYWKATLNNTSVNNLQYRLFIVIEEILNSAQKSSENNANTSGTFEKKETASTENKTDNTEPLIRKASNTSRIVYAILSIAGIILSIFFIAIAGSASENLSTAFVNAYGSVNQSIFTGDYYYQYIIPTKYVNEYYGNTDGFVDFGTGNIYISADEIEPEFVTEIIKYTSNEPANNRTNEQDELVSAYYGLMIWTVLQYLAIIATILLIIAAIMGKSISDIIEFIKIIITLVVVGGIVIGILAKILPGLFAIVIAILKVLFKIAIVVVIIGLIIVLISYVKDPKKKNNQENAESNMPSPNAGNGIMQQDENAITVTKEEGTIYNKDLVTDNGNDNGSNTINDSKIKYCTSCGRAIDDTATFCIYCGKKV